MSNIIDEMYSMIEKQVSFGYRRPGSDADHMNEDFLFNTLKSYGIQKVYKEPIHIKYWNLKGYKLVLAIDGKKEEVNSFPVAYSAFTTSEGVNGELVFVSSKKLVSSGDWKGKIVVTEIEFPEIDAGMMKLISTGYLDPEKSFNGSKQIAVHIRHGWHIYKQAMKKGAIGFIGILKNQPCNNCEMFGPYGFREKDIHDKPIPGVWIGNEDGKRIKRIFAEHNVKVNLTVEGTLDETVTNNIVGVIPGETDENIVISCHHDSPFYGAVEDASGISVVMQLAKHFAKEKKLKRNIIVLLSAGHFYGSIGTRTFIKNNPDIVNNTALEITVEHIALDSDDSGIKPIPTNNPATYIYFTSLNKTISKYLFSEIKGNNLTRSAILPARGVFGDYPSTDGGDWFVHNVPMINMISGPSYLLTSTDNLEFVDKDRLEGVYNCFREFIEKIDKVDSEELKKRHWPLLNLLTHVINKGFKWIITRFGLHDFEY